MGSLARCLHLEGFEVLAGDFVQPGVLADFGGDAFEVLANLCHSLGRPGSVREQQGVALDAVRDEDEGEELFSGEGVRVHGVGEMICSRVSDESGFTEGKPALASGVSGLLAANDMI